MKRWLVWSFVSAATFLVGTVLVFAYMTLTEPIFTVERVPPVAEKVPTFVEPAPVEDDFNAEIYDISHSGLGLDREPDFDFNNIIESGTLEVSSHFTDIRRGDKKFVMFEQNGNYHLRRSSSVFATTPRVKGESHYLVSISFKGPGKAVIIFPDLPFFKDGIIKTLYLRPRQSEIDKRGLPIGYSLWKNERRSFALGNEYYTLRVSRAVASDERNLSILLLEKDTEKQVIDAIEFYGDADETFTDLIWAGDLDRDGKLDLITDGTQGIMLHVSSKAEPGKLVKLVSTGGVEGC